MDASAELRPVVSILPAGLTAGTHNGTGVDTKGFSEALVVVISGANGSGGTVDVKVQESHDNSTFVDVTGAAFTQITGSNDETIYVGRIRMTPSRRRYLRAVAVVATATCVASVIIVLADGSPELPVSQVNTAAFNINA